MWWLAIIIISTDPYTQPRGSLNVPFVSEEKCREAKRQLIGSFSIEGYRMSATCTVR